MRTTRLRRAAYVALPLLVAGALTACEPTGHPRCDALVRQVVTADSFGYRIRCDATFPGTSNEGRSVLGWADHDSKTIWIWPNKITDDRVLRKIAWHEIGHVVWDRKGRTGTHDEEERWADGYAYCAEPIKGVSYTIRPTNCSSYRA